MSALPPEYIIKRLRELGPSERIIYFSGFLEEERVRNPDSPATAIAFVAYGLMERGLIHLTQKRISAPRILTGEISWSKGVGAGFHYIATGALPKRKLRVRWT